jgi:hypothetical protein
LFLTFSWKNFYNSQSSNTFAARKNIQRLKQWEEHLNIEKHEKWSDGAIWLAPSLS